MKTIASLSEASARPSATRIPIIYKRNGELVKVKVREALYAALMNSKDRIADATGKNLSQTILIRRALDLYLTQLAKMDEGQLVQESHHLVQRHR
jgi:hypothetical protein